MILETLILENFKGRTAKHELAQMTFFTGKNGTGKSAVRDAIVIGLGGEHPTYGKTNPALFKLSSGSKMEIGLEGPGFNIRRKWEQKGKTIKASSLGAEAVADMPMIMLDAAAFIGATDEARLKTIFSLAKVDASIQKITQAVLDSLADTGQGPAIESLLKPLEEELGNPQKWIDGSLSRFAESAKAQKAEIDRLTKAAQGLAQLAAGDGTLNATTIAVARNGHDAAISAMVAIDADLKARIGSARRRATEIEAWRKERAALVEKAAKAGDKTAAMIAALGQEAQAALQEAKDTHGKLSADWKAESELRAELLELTNQATVIDQRLKQERPKAEAALASGLERIKEVQANERAILESKQELERIALHMREAATAIVQAEEKIAALRERHGHILQASECPTCHAIGEQWKQTVLDQIQGEIDEINARRNSDEIAANAESAKGQQLEARLATWEPDTARQRKAIEAEIAQAQGKLAEFNADAGRLGQIRQDIARKQAKAKPEMAPPPPLDVSAMQANVEALRAAWGAANARETLDGMKEPPAPENVEELERQRVENEGKLQSERQSREALRDKESQLAQQQGEARRLQQAEDERLEVEANAAAIAAAAKALRAEKEKLSAIAFKPLLEKVAVFTQGILRTSVEMHEGEIGRFEGGIWQALRTFSGTELAVTAAGIQAALGSQSPAKLVIVDELGRFDEPNKIKFADNVAAAIKAGIIDQFVGMDVNSIPWQNLPIDGLKVIELSRK